MLETKKKKIVSYISIFNYCFDVKPLVRLLITSYYLFEF